MNKNISSFVKVRFICLLIVSLHVSFQSFGQKSFQPKIVDLEWKGIVYRNEYTGNLTLHTNGYSLAYNSGKLKTYYKTNYYHVELGYLKDSREQNQNKNIPISINKATRSFKYGKQNSLFVLRAGKGIKKLLTDKTKRKGVAIGYNVEAGPSIAFLKPYYLDLLYTFKDDDDKIYNELRTEKYSSENAEKFLNYNSIFGGGPASKGWSELSVVPGVQGKLGLFFSLGAFEEYARSFEVGVMCDMYIKKIPIMVETQAISNKPYFVNFYLTFEFGKRKN